MGGWKDNKQQGYGIEEFPNGDIYEGNFEKGQKHGQIKFYSKENNKWED